MDDPLKNGDLGAENGDLGQDRLRDDRVRLHVSPPSVFYRRPCASVAGISLTADVSGKQGVPSKAGQRRVNGLAHDSNGGKSMLRLHRTALVLLASLILVGAACASGPAQEWTQQPGFILGPTQAWEGDVVQEPTVIQVGKVFHMFYSGGYADCFMGHAVSSDGLHWRKGSGPVLGGGIGGEPLNACHSHVFRDQGKFWATYAPNKRWADPSLRLAVSTDGVRWQRFEQPILAPVDDERSIANTYPLKVAGQWVVLFETFTYDDRWELGIATGPDLFHLTRDPFGKLTTLRRVGMYGGPWITREGSGWRLYFHASRTPRGNLPTDIYTATSGNLREWSLQDDPVVWRSQGYQYDQVADPCVIVVNGRTRMYFDGFDNREPGHARIGVASLPGRHAMR